jgi:hypothetical protein
MLGLILRQIAQGLFKMVAARNVTHPFLHALPRPGLELLAEPGLPLTSALF